MASPTLVAGHVWSENGFFQGWLSHREGRIQDIGHGPPPRAPDAHGVIVPAPVNAHTHVGDAIVRGQDLRGKTLAQLVAPPDGLKHRALAAATDEQIARGIRDVAREMHAAGTRRFIDFREMGLRGLAQLREGVRDTRVTPLVMARPASPDADTHELRAVLAQADGFGISALRDVGNARAQRLAAQAHAVGKKVALHLSEAERESVDDALDLRPWLLVHLLHATPDDLARVAQARVPVAVCPRSNAFFGKLAPVPEMRRAGIDVVLGTDNAMLAKADLFEEMRFLHHAIPRLATQEVLRAGLIAGRRLLDLDLAPGAPAEILVLAPQGPRPESAILGPQPPAIVHAPGHL